MPLIYKIKLNHVDFACAQLQGGCSYYLNKLIFCCGLDMMLLGLEQYYLI